MNNILENIINNGNVLSGTPMIIQAKELVENFLKSRDRIIDNSIHNIYYFGSRVYGSSDDKSDYDFIAVVNDTYGDSLLIKNNITVHIYSIKEWTSLIERHDIQALECMFLLPELMFINDKDKYDNFEIDLWKLRKEISTVSSNSWVKGKKKLIITADYDLRLALKSIFHSLRILELGVQLALSNTIIDYGRMNYVLTDLWKMSETHTRQELWEQIDTKYRKLFNRLKSQLVELCPKDKSFEDDKVQLKKIFKNHGYDDHMEEVIADIINHFKN